MSPTRGRQLWLIPVLLVVVALTAVGAVIARGAYREPQHPQDTAVLPTHSSGAQAPGPGSRQVMGTQDATAHPLFPAVHTLLQSFFDAINDKDFDKWRGSVTAAKAAQTSEDEWQHDYRTTRDGSIVVYRIETGAPGTAKALLSFVSTQELAEAPPELQARCIRWHVVFPLTLRDGRWLIDAGLTGASPQHDRC